MSVTTVSTKITREYLKGKSKDDLIQLMLMYANKDSAWLADAREISGLLSRALIPAKLADSNSFIGTENSARELVLDIEFWIDKIEKVTK